MLGTGEGAVLLVGGEGLGAEVVVLEQEGTQAGGDEAREEVVGLTFAPGFGFRLVHLHSEGLRGVIEAEDEMDKIGGCAEEGTRGVLFVRPWGSARVGVSERATIAIAHGKSVVVFRNASRHRLNGEREGDFTHKNTCFGQFIYILSRLGEPSIATVLCYGNVTAMLRQCFEEIGCKGNNNFGDIQTKNGQFSFLHQNSTFISTKISKNQANMFFMNVNSK